METTINDIFKELTEHYDLTAIGAVLTFLTILATFWKQVGEPLYNTTVLPIAKLFYSIYESPTKLEQVNTKLDLLIKEFQPNSGTSIKDQLNRLENSHAMSEDQRRLLMNTSPHGIWTSDATGYMTWLNTTFINKVGAGPEELLGNNWINCIHPEDRKKVVEEWGSAVKDGRIFNLFYRLINLDTQAPINVKAIGTPAKNFNGVIIGYNGTVYFT
jgi:PAS domain-containing protein